MTISGKEELDFRYYQKLRVGALFSGLSAGLLYMSFGAISMFSGTQSEVDYLRFAISILIILYSVTFYILVSKKTRFSEVFVGCSSFLFIGTVPLLAHFASMFGTSLTPWLTTSVILGLFLHYSVLNLRAVPSLIFGLLSTTVSWFYFSSQEDSEAARSLVFLVMANLVGFYVVRRSMESEEAEVLARAQMKENWYKLREMRGAFKVDISEHKRWIAAFSHEINQPLYLASNLVGKISLLNSTTHAGKETFATLLGELNLHLDDISTMFDVLLRQAKSPHDLINVRLSWVGLEGLLSDAVSHIQKEKKIPSDVVEITASDLESSCLYTDGYLMKRILRNLLENSIKFSGQELGRVFVNFAFRESRKEFVVRIVNPICAPVINTDGDGQVDGAYSAALGLGLGVGHRFISRVNNALPGQRTKVRVVKDRFAVARISFSYGYFAFDRSRDSVLRSKECPNIFVCSEDRGFIGDCSFYLAGLGLPMNARSIAEFSEIIMSGEVFSAAHDGVLFIIEISQGFLSAVDYFGFSLREKMLACGRYVFVSNFTLDESFQEIGLCVRRVDLSVKFFESVAV